MKLKRIVVWFRQDLRLHDNEALHYALERCDEIVPVYVFDERQFFDKTSFGFSKTDKYRTQFIIESVLDLKKSLQAIGSNLIIRIGKPEDEIYEIAKEVQASWVYCNRERTQEEVEVQNKLEKNLWSIGMEINYFRGKMLFYTQDLPFPVSHTPDTFSSFKKEVERIVPIRKPFDTPTSIAPISISIDEGQCPKISYFKLPEPQVDDRSVYHFKGGETEALARLKEFIWEDEAIKTYEDTRNGLIGTNYSSKLSPWLAQGCLSPKTIFYEVKAYETERIKNKSTYKLIYELYWRDFFRLMAKKHGNLVFLKGGYHDKSNPNWESDWTLFNIWKDGRTGIPFIDANMRELQQTGFMSNRGRQNVASFLIHDLKVNWLMGAEYFESMLLDYDPASNYGNWNYIAGVGSDPRPDRHFNVLTQAKKYDPEGEYVKQWIPELSDVPHQKIHDLESLSEEEQIHANIRLGDDYPKSIISTKKWSH